MVLLYQSSKWKSGIMTYFYATEKTTQVVFDTVMHPSIMGSIQNLVQQNIPTRYNCTGDLTRIPQWWYFLCNVVVSYYRKHFERVLYMTSYLQYCGANSNSVVHLT